MGRLSDPIHAMQDHYDVIVVGSGYGGGIAASRMARAGRRVGLLERGRELQPGEYPGTALEASEELQLDFPNHHVGSRTGLYDLRLNDELHVVVGCGLGGTSLINANVSLRADPRVFADPRWPDPLRTGGSLDAFYGHAEAMLRPRPYPEEAPVPLKLRALERSARGMGRPERFYRPPLNVTFQDGINHVGVRQRACTNCGDCVGGCNHGAKNTTLMNYLPDARNHGAQIFTCCAVRRVERAEDGVGWTVHYQQLESGREAFDAPEAFVRADMVVLAAGALGSTEILLRSQQAGLATSSMVGRRLTGNGDVLGFAYNADEPVHGIGTGARSRNGGEAVGPCITGIIDLRDTDDLADGMVVEEGSIPGAMGDVMPVLLATAAKLVGTDTDRGLADHVSETGRELSSLTLGPRHGAVRNTQTFLVMSHDDGEGRLLLRDDRVRVSWPGVGEQPVFARVGEALLEATRALGATYVPDPISTRVPFDHDLVTVHPLGGCPMGRDAATGAVDERGRVFAGTAGTDVHDGLYVMDGAIVPRPLGVNPLLTISALAERCCALAAADRGWTIDYGFASRPPATRTPEPLGIHFTERMAGRFDIAGPARATDLAFVLTVDVDDVDRFIADPDHEARMAGIVEAPALSTAPLTVRDGRFNLFAQDLDRVETRLMRYRMRLEAEDGREYFFTGTKTIHDDPGPDLWADTTTLAIEVRDGRDATAPFLGQGQLRISPSDFRRQLTTMRVSGADDLAEALSAKARFSRFFAGTLADLYGGVLARNNLWDPQAPPRARRQLRVTAPEVHTVVTDDGVPLRLTRFGGGGKGPVVLTHGLGVSSLIFSLDTIETNLVEYLFAHGFDVWLLDYRASIELPSSRSRFNADDVAKLDYPAAIAKVRAITRADSVQVVAHCFGATTFTCAMLAGLEGVRSAVLSQVATDIAGPLMSRLKAGLHVPDVLDAFGVDALTARTGRDASWRGRLFNAIAEAMPTELEERCHNPVCHRISFMYAPLYEHDQLDGVTHDAGLREMFGVANVESFEHLALMIRKGHVVDADGEDRYLPHVDRLAMPIAFLHGSENACFTTAGMDRTLERLSSANGSHFYTRHEIPRYGHIDCIFGRDAHRDVYPLIGAHLQGAGA